MVNEYGFEFKGEVYHFHREFSGNKWYFTVHCGKDQVVHPEISTVISETKENMAEFDREHGRSAYEVFAFEHLMNIVTHIIPIADKRWSASQELERDLTNCT